MDSVIGCFLYSLSYWANFYTEKIRIEKYSRPKKNSLTYAVDVDINLRSWIESHDNTESKNLLGWVLQTNFLWEKRRIISKFGLGLQFLFDIVKFPKINYRINLKKLNVKMGA